MNREHFIRTVEALPSCRAQVAAGHVVEMKPDADGWLVLTVTKSASGKRFGPDGIGFRAPFSEMNVTQAGAYLSDTLDSLKAAGQ